MAESHQNAPLRKRRFLGRKLVWIAVGLPVFLLALYYVVTSSAFIQAVVLPRVGRALNANLTVSKVSLSPFSQLVLQGLRLQTSGAEPLLEAEEAKVRYSLWSLLTGRIQAQEIKLESPKLLIVRNADRTSNLDPLLQALQPAETKAIKPKPAQPAQVAAQNIALNRGNIQWLELTTNQGRQRIELANLNVSLDKFQNEQGGKLALEADFKLEQGRAVVSATNDMVQAKINGAFAFKLDAALLPETVTGAARFEIMRAQGAWLEAGALAGALECQLSPTEIRQLALRFERGGTPLGQLRISGPVDLGRTEGRLGIELLSIDRNVLNLFGAARGWDFAQSILNASNLVEIAQQGKRIAARGRVTGNQLSLRQQGQASPALDVDLDYQFSVDLPGQSALVERLMLVGKQGSAELLRAALDRPMNLSWGAKASGFRDSSFRLALTNLNLADWRFLAGENMPTGRIDLEGYVLAQQDGHRLSGEVSGKIHDLSAQFGTNNIMLAALQLQLKGQLNDFQNVNVELFRFAATDAERSVAAGEGSVNYDLKDGNCQARATIEAEIPALLQKYPVPLARATAGKVKFAGLLTRQKQSQSLLGVLALTDFTGRYGDHLFQDYQADLDVDLEINTQQALLKHATLTTRQSSAPGGSCSLSGAYGLKQKTGQFSFAATDLNRHALSPIIAPWLAPWVMNSVNLNATGTASYDPKKESSLQADLSFTNLVVKGPSGALPPRPLAARLQVDAGQQGQKVSIRQCLLALSPTARARNQLQLQGNLDFTQTNAITGQLALQSDALDVTPLYELWHAPDTTNAPASTPAKAAAASSNTEPGAEQLPLQNCGLTAKIDRLFLGEIFITNLHSAVKINGGQIAVNPFQLDLNGGLIKGNALLNLGVPGYIYDLSAQADKMPVEPIINSLAPAARGQYKGDVTAQIQLKGAGVTGTNLQKNLAGQLAFSFTNANISLLHPKANMLIAPVAVLLRVPELAKSPLESAAANARLGNGQVAIQQLSALSPAFYAEAQGTIPLAPVLTNSPLNLPVAFWLRRSLAEKANLVPDNATPGAKYVKLPDFIKVTGTLGHFETKTDKIAIVGLLSRSAAIIPGVAGTKVGNVLDNVGSALSGGKQGLTNVIQQLVPSLITKTNLNPSIKTNQPPKPKPLNIFQDIIKR